MRMTVKNIFIFLVSALQFIHAAPSSGCSRVPEGVYQDKSPADGRYILKVSGTTDKYEPGQRYGVTLMGIQGIASSAHTFIGFFLTVEHENSDSRNASDPAMVGTFELVDPTKTKFSEKCQHLITHTNVLPKTKVQVNWIAPGPGRGCVYIRATVIEHRNVWYMDDNPLTKQLCEVQQDDIDNQPQILQDCCACDEAKYELIFEGRWSRHTHPKDFPADNWRTGFSDIIGASHTIDYRYWQYGELASEGLREVAEHGSTRKLESELKEQSDQIRTIIKARGISYPNVTGKTFAVFRVDNKHHLISLVSMIQPSPDWIVGVSGLELCLPNCSWIEHKVHNLYPWDAGTDGGPSYLSSDEPEIRPDVIRRIKSNFPNDPRSPFFDPSGAPMKPLARLHISRRRLYQKNCEVQSEPSECATLPWTRWSECSSKCGYGKRSRTRQFKNPLLASQLSCKNTLYEEEVCSGKRCDEEENDNSPANGQSPECTLSDWSDWSSCSSECGKGTRTRTRTYLIRKNHKKCQGMNRQVLQLNEDCEGTNCAGNIAEEEEPQEVPRECRVSDWSLWTPCNATCGEGVRSRTRQVWNTNRRRLGHRNSYNDNDEEEDDDDPCSHIKRNEEVTCTGTNCEERPEYCNDEPTTNDNCRDSKVSGFWYYDVQKQTCALFFAGRCNKDQNKFNSREECLQTCQEKIEPQSESLRFVGDKVDCKVSEWKLHPCNVTCGEGYQIKTKDVLRSPRNGGKSCPKKLVRIEKCVMRKCQNDITESAPYRKKSQLQSMSLTDENENDFEETENPHCRYTKWGPWSPCTASCGRNSFRQKTRNVISADYSPHKCVDRVRLEKCNVPLC